MKKLLTILALTAMAGVTMAQDVTVKRQELGSGTPGFVGQENAGKWSNDIYHAPQYMPHYPTAATLWPRVVDVDCVKVDNRLDCKGYNWLPELGRGEYLMIRPRIAEAPKIVPVLVPGPIREVYIEVPVKKKKE